MKKNRKNSLSGKIFVFSILLTGFISLFIVSLIAFQYNRKKLQKQSLFHIRAFCMAQSANAVMLHEIRHKPSEKRWREGWMVSGNRYVFTDTDGTYYKNSYEILKNPPGFQVLSLGKYENVIFTLQSQYSEKGILVQQKQK